jgi:hypothetical protein
MLVSNRDQAIASDKDPMNGTEISVDDACEVKVTCRESAKRVPTTSD